MKLRLLYFGIVREKLGRREETRDVRSAITVGELLGELADSDGIFAIGAGSIRVAVNREYAGNEHVLADNDEVAVIPPVAGGCEPPVQAVPRRCASARVGSPGRPLRNHEAARRREDSAS